MSTDGQRTLWRRNIAENFNRLSRAHERHRRQTTDDRLQTDRRWHIANMNLSSRSLKTYRGIGLSSFFSHGHCSSACKTIKPWHWRTPDFISPELWSSNSSVIWSLGLRVYGLPEPEADTGHEGMAMAPDNTALSKTSSTDWWLAWLKAGVQLHTDDRHTERTM